MATTAAAGEWVLDLPARTPRALLQELARERQQRPTERGPTLQLLLRGGQTVSGWIVRVADDPAVLVLQLDHAGPPFGDVAILELREVTGVVVRAGHDHPHWLGPPGPPTPSTRLELRRRARAWESELRGRGQETELAVDWDALGDGPAERLLFADALEALASAWDALGQDDLGHDALGRIHRVEIAVNRQAASALTLQGSTLSVRLADDAAPGLLRDELERLL